MQFWLTRAVLRISLRTRIRNNNTPVTFWIAWKKWTYPSVQKPRKVTGQFSQLQISKGTWAWEDSKRPILVVFTTCSWKRVVAWFGRCSWRRCAVHARFCSTCVFCLVWWGWLRPVFSLSLEWSSALVQHSRLRTSGFTSTWEARCAGISPIYHRWEWMLLVYLPYLRVTPKLIFQLSEMVLSRCRTQCQRKTQLHEHSVLLHKD